MEPQTTCANPLLLEWVKEWYDTAKERSSKGVTTYKHAYDSLLACPTVFNHPSELQKLKGFGAKLCERLTEQLRRYCDENGLPMPEHPMFQKKQKRRGPNNGGADGDEGEDDGEDERPAKKPRKRKAYVPTYRSGPYAIILALSMQDPDEVVGMSKEKLIEVAQPHCDASFTVPLDTTRFYTAWNSIKVLEQKELVQQRGGRLLKRYLLTEEGQEMAIQMRALAAENGQAIPETGHRAVSQSLDAAPARPTFTVDKEPPLPAESEYKNVVADGDSGAPSNAGLPTFTPIVLQPGSFTVELVLDQREMRAKTDRDYLRDQLAQKGVVPQVRSLEVGDVLWVAKCKDAAYLSNHGAEGDEIALDYVIERKRLDDMIGSIKDGRLKEQKYRLKRSGLKNVIYLIEDFSVDAGHLSKYEDAIESTIAQMQVADNILVKRTLGVHETIAYLVHLTKRLRMMHENKPLHVIPTQTFNSKNYLGLVKHLRETREETSFHISYPALASLASKSDLLTLRDTFLKMLMVTKGVTAEKAIEMQRIWKTPHEFVRAFEQCDAQPDARKCKADLVSSRLAGLVGRKKIGAALSLKIAEVWADL